MRLTRGFKIEYRDDLTHLFKTSKNLYNQALYILNQEYKNSGKYISYGELDKIMKRTFNLEKEINYKLLPAQTSQQILKLLDKNYKSFFKSIKDYKSNPTKYKGTPKPPKYKKEYNILIYTNQNSKIKDKSIKLSKVKEVIKIPKNIWVDELLNYKQIRILPKKSYIKVEIIYEVKELNPKLDKNSYASIDLGVNNIITLITNIKTRPLIINGKPLKSFNLYYNKLKSKYQSIKDKQGIKQNTKRIIKIEEKRENYFSNIFHQISRKIINYLLDNKISKLVIGYNKEWKNDVKMRKSNKQTFIQIPFNKLLQYLEYKANLVGIEVIYQEESYTSKADALNFDKIPNYKKDKKGSYQFSGKRVKRGLYKSAKGVLLNSDVNGAINILRKVIGDAFIKLSDIGLWSNPVKINPLQTIPIKVYNYV